jgi:hypothetical protein
VLEELAPGQRLAVDANGRFDIETAKPTPKRKHTTTSSGMRKPVTRLIMLFRPNWRSITRVR